MTVPLAQKLAECSAVIEIWHKIPKNDTHPAPVAGKVFGRRLVPAFKDVCLGQTVIPLIKLLEKQTGDLWIINFSGSEARIQCRIKCVELKVLMHV